MGFGLPAAMGVQLAYPKSEVICVTGEASILMCIQELATCLQYRLPIKVITLNNRYMGMVRQWQEFFYEGRYAMSYMEAIPDFVQLASSFGHVGIKIEKGITAFFDGTMIKKIVLNNWFIRHPNDQCIRTGPHKCGISNDIVGRWCPILIRVKCSPIVV